MPAQSPERPQRIGGTGGMRHNLSAGRLCRLSRLLTLIANKGRDLVFIGPILVSGEAFRGLANFCATERNWRRA
jgi:hypothetical protein